VVLPKTRNEIISPESYFFRGTRGTRTDVVTFYDPITLQSTGEVEILSKRMTPVKPQGTTALSDDEKFLLIVNLTPATSIRMVNLDERTFVGEIAIWVGNTWYHLSRNSKVHEH
jgi:methylamine dehydrogenase heavy chain